jgi:hypothetical protein
MKDYRVSCWTIIGAESEKEARESFCRDIDERNVDVELEGQTLHDNTWNCKNDCIYITPDGCYIDDKMPNPRGTLSCECENGSYPLCPRYVQAEKANQNNHWQDKPDKAGYWWRYHPAYRIPQLTEIFGEKELLVNYAGILIVSVDTDLKEYYPDSKWLYIEQPEAPEAGGE